ncbi:MAG: LysE family translocator [Pseudomonadota bacterium]
MPVEPTTLLAFAATSILLLIVPGPTVLMVMSQAMAHGRKVGTASVAGVALGDLVATALSVSGLGALLAASATAFTIAKLIGAAWLVWLGLRLLFGRRSEGAEMGAAPPSPGRRVFRDAFLVTATNPKGILFFLAFVPQFIDPGRPFAPQAATFVLVFTGLGALNAAAYVWAADRMRRALRRPRLIDAVARTGGALLVAAGLAAAFTRRTA